MDYVTWKQARLWEITSAQDLPSRVSGEGSTELRFLPITLSCFQVTGHNPSEGNLSHLIALRFPQILLKLL
jgi:hypothetical protein